VKIVVSFLVYGFALFGVFIALWLAYDVRRRNLRQYRADEYEYKRSDPQDEADEADDRETLDEGDEDSDGPRSSPRS